MSTDPPGPLGRRLAWFVGIWAASIAALGAVAMVLNAPWLDMQGSTMMRTVGTVAIKRIGRRTPYRVVPRKSDGFYARSLHLEHEGECLPR